MSRSFACGSKEGQLIRETIGAAFDSLALTQPSVFTLVLIAAASWRAASCRCCAATRFRAAAQPDDASRHLTMQSRSEQRVWRRMQMLAPLRNPECPTGIEVQERRQAEDGVN